MLGQPPVRCAPRQTCQYPASLHGADSFENFQSSRFAQLIRRQRPRIDFIVNTHSSLQALLQHPDRLLWGCSKRKYAPIGPGRIIARQFLPELIELFLAQGFGKRPEGDPAREVPKKHRGIFAGCRQHAIVGGKGQTINAAQMSLKSMAQLSSGHLIKTYFAIVAAKGGHGQGPSIRG
ncbi:MAG TPA: hypothetical protein VG055_29965 [Planctomycetaceae bacterium]|nr:hypothetical protein [Planctomycetaceae bacterium]